MPSKKASSDRKAPKGKSDAPTDGNARDTPNSASSPAKKVVQKKIYQKLDKDGAMPIPIDVTFEGTNVASKAGKSNAFSHTLKLQAPDLFTLCKTIMMPEGSQYESYQAILLKPSRAFQFMKLADEVRILIYREYFAPVKDAGSDLPDNILIDAKRGSNKQAYAKQYANGSKNRVALLATSRSILEQAAPVLYDQTFRFESTVHLMDFLSSLPPIHRNKLRKVEINNYSRPASRMALNLLAEAKSLTCLTIELNVVTDADITRAAKAFWSDAAIFLDAMFVAKGGKEEAFNVLEFGKHALCVKTSDNKLRSWTPSMVDEFKACLKAKMK